MIKRVVQWPVFMLGLGTLGYGTFFVPLGERTLYEHLVRIAGTDEAQELGRGVDEAAGQAAQSAYQKLREPLGER